MFKLATTEVFVPFLLFFILFSIFSKTNYISLTNRVVIIKRQNQWQYQLTSEIDEIVQGN